MNRLYIPVLVAAVVLVAYYAGMRISDARCGANNAIAATNAQTAILKLKGEINAETFHTATVDIRRMLREKYTIAD